MLGRPLIEQFEVEGSLAELLGPQILDLKPLGLLGFGAGYPFGFVTSVSLEGEWAAAADRVRQYAG